MQKISTSLHCAHHSPKQDIKSPLQQGLVADRPTRSRPLHSPFTMPTTQACLTASTSQPNPIPATTTYHWYDIHNSTNGDSLCSGIQISAAAPALPALPQSRPSELKEQSSVPSPMEVTSDASPTQQRLERELIDKRFSHFRSVGQKSF